MRHRINGCGRLWLALFPASALVLTSAAAALQRGAAPLDESQQRMIGELGSVYQPAGPIVNEIPGVPGWTQRDVEALRQAIRDSLLHLANLELALQGRADLVKALPPYTNELTYLRGEDDLLIDRLETRASLGNFMGQAITRAIDVSDIVTLDDAVVDDEVEMSIVQYLGFYEGLKARALQQAGEVYAPTAHQPVVTAMIDQVAPLLSNGTVGKHEDIAADTAPLLGGAGCYFIFPFGVGWTQLAGDTTLWVGSEGTYDNVSMDVLLGFFFYYFPCANEIAATAIRISSNGYVTFHQFGGGGADGLDGSNDPLPSAVDPDHFAAPWWDDLIVTAQGSTDRVSYKVEGAAGSAVMTVQWFSISRVGGDTTEFHRFQLKLLQASGQVQFHYDTTWIPDSVDNATTGLENMAGTLAFCAFNCGNNNSAAPDLNFDFFVPQPSNDSCANAICLEDSEVVEGHNFGATGSNLTSCASTDNYDVWYVYTPPFGGNVTVTTCGDTDLDTSVSVFTECGGAELACNDQDVACPTLAQSTVTFAAAANEDYYIRVAGALGKRGQFEVSARIGVNGIEGDICETCRVIGSELEGLFFTTNNMGCFNDSSCGGANDIVDEWFCWTAPASGMAEATTCFGPTDFDTTIAVFDDCPASGGVEIACNDDDPYSLPACELSPGNFFKSRVRWFASAGTTYRIRVAGFAMAEGDYFLRSRIICPADLVDSDTFQPPGDGVVDAADLAFLLGEWDAPPVSPADFVNSGTFAPPPDGFVDAADLAVLLGMWGECP
jgi:hypothetical protein